ncbi:Serine/threonine-protein kinase plk1 [Linnemannia schmuckeri]|uniref:Serine/threonine-protein kinase plk1 n=1 Tax=Linnemannia schmuckeri TaxID=64567 RepID=A0A9P5RGY2_9FUNG|nr:Serine/threonine-protein kinase plk1 [Linnemannia schmuckeri]
MSLKRAASALSSVSAPSGSTAIDMNSPLSNKTGKVRRSNAKKPMAVPRKLGIQEETELYLRTLIENRRAGRLENPTGDDLAPIAPEVFVNGWIYAHSKYGLGFRLSNGVHGVACNDNMTVVMSPNGIDLEVIHGTRLFEPYNLKRKRKRRRPIDSADSSLSSRATKELDTYNEMDDQDRLKTLERSYFQMGNIPPQFAKNVGNIFHRSLPRSARGDAWTFVDEDLKQDMPFLTDNFKYDYYVVCLSNGVIQVDFPDKSTILLSQRGRVLTFMDGEEKNRRVTLMTHQAFSAEFFYALDDPKDQAITIQDELDQINQTRDIQGALDQQRDLCDRHKDGDHSGDDKCRVQTRETRPLFDSDKDTDLCLFPRPSLASQNAKASQGILPLTQDLLAAGQDASQIEERPLTSDDKQVVIRQMTFKTLHEEIVLRLRIAQRLMRERAILLAKERLKKEKEERAKKRRQCD